MAIWHSPNFVDTPHKLRGKSNLNSLQLFEAEVLSIKADSGQVGGGVQRLDALACVELTWTAVSDRSDGVVHWKKMLIFLRGFLRGLSIYQKCILALV